jgi:hypothetical protein
MTSVAPSPGPRSHRESFLQKWHRITWSDRVLLWEGMVFLSLSSLAIRAIPPRIIQRTATWSSRRALPSPQERLAVLARTRWAVLACARRVPWRAVCYQQGLAAQWMLRRRGIPSVIYYGAAPDEEKGLLVHVWVRDGEIDVIGGEGASRLAVLATFPARSDRNPVATRP